MPLMPSRMNDVRADTKRVDVCRMSAAGVFSNVPVYASRKAKGEILVANHVDLWIETIGRLITDTGLRSEARSATVLAVQAMVKGEGYAAWP